jgi:hypothetical protein
MHNKHIVRPAIATGLLLLIPAVMNIVDRSKAPGDGWNWGPGDFLVMAGLLFSAGLLYELVAARTRSRRQRLAVGAVVAALVFAVWAELAVDGLSQLAAFLLS